MTELTVFSSSTQQFFSVYSFNLQPLENNKLGSYINIQEEHQPQLQSDFENTPADQPAEFFAACATSTADNNTNSDMQMKADETAEELNSFFCGTITFRRKMCMML